MSLLPALIVGAGPAGLAVAACLKRQGTGFEILERSDRVGSSWHAHYDRLRLHSANRFSSLPGMPFPRHYPEFVPRRLFIEYLEAYSRELGIQPRFGEDVVSAGRDGVSSTWRVTTAGGSRYEARSLVIASGYNREPYVPSFPGAESFPGPRPHSSSYRNGEPYRGMNVLVIGMGNTGAELALDLDDHGARASICVRGPVHVSKRELLGRSPQAIVILAERFLGPRAADFFLWPVQAMADEASPVSASDLLHEGFSRTWPSVAAFP